MSPPPSDRLGYNIAIICAMPEERAAMEAVLDKDYSDGTEEEERIVNRYGIADDDENQYIYGELAEKPVVMVTSKGKGTLNVALVAKDLRQSFRNIAVALVVGITGGAPFTAEQDESGDFKQSGIRLGDVIISGAMFEYDSGKQYENGFESNMNHEERLAAAGGRVKGFLVSLEGGSNAFKRLEKDTNADFDHLPKLRDHGDRNYSYPGRARDHIFHVEEPHRCRRSCAVCDTQDGVCPRATRSTCQELKCQPGQYPIGQDRNECKVFIGPYVAGSGVMKSARKRQELVQKYGALAIEMEGAGVWAVLPTIVVKGVVDYADSHKNKVWRDYPAARAALCAKSIVSRLVLPALPGSIEEGDRRREEENRRAEESRRSEQESRRAEEERCRTEEACQDCLRALFLTDPTKHVQKARGISRDGKTARRRDGRAPDTCQWIEMDNSYQRWQQAPAPALLCIMGEAGIGKTILSTHLVENVLPQQLPASDSRLAYFFCNNNTAEMTRNNAGAILRGLLWLLLDRNHTLYEHFQKDYSSKGKSCFEDDETLWSIFQAIVTSSSLKHTYLCVLIDAFDECEVLSRGWLCMKLTGLVRNNSVHLKIILTSRQIPDSDDLWTSCTDSTWATYKIEMDTSKIKADLAAFIQHEVGYYEENGHWKHGRLSTIRKWVQDTAVKVRAKLVSNHGGTFLWVSIVLDSLATRPQLSVLKELDHFPNELWGVYERILKEIEESRNEEYATRILHLVFNAKAPMSLNVLSLVLYFDMEKPENLPEQDRLKQYRHAILEACGMLLRMNGDPDTNQVTIIHQSVKDHIAGDHAKGRWYYSPLNLSAEETFSEICTTYLCTEDFNVVAKDALRLHAETAALLDPSKGWPPTELTNPSQPSWNAIATSVGLLRYLGRFFNRIYLRTLADKHPELFKKVYALSSSFRRMNDIYANLLTGEDAGGEEVENMHAGPRHILWRLMTLALRKNYNDVLLVVCTLCHIESPDHSRWGKSWLQCCSDELTLDLLAIPVVSGNPDAAKTLAEWFSGLGEIFPTVGVGRWGESLFNLDWSMPSRYNLPPASEDISQRIAAFDALVLGLSGCDTPLHIMVEKGEITALERIFDDNNRVHPHGRKELLAMKDKYGNTPLKLAFLRARANCAALLIKSDPDRLWSQVMDERGNSALHVAAAFSAEVTEVLLEADSERKSLYARNDVGDIPLHRAVTFSAEITQMLLQSDVERQSTYMKNDVGEIPLHRAVRVSAGVTQMLLQADVERQSIYTRDDEGRLPLHVAAHDDGGRNHVIRIEIIELLIKADLESKSVLAQDNDGKLVLHGALSSSQFPADVLVALLDTVQDKTSLFVKDSSGNTHFRFEPLQDVTTRWTRAFVELLMDRGILIKALSANYDDGLTPLDRCFRAMHTTGFTTSLPRKLGEPPTLCVLATIANALRDSGVSANSLNPIANEKDQMGIFTIHHVASRPWPVVVLDAVLKAGDPRTIANARDNAGLTPLDHVYKRYSWLKAKGTNGVFHYMARLAILEQRLREVGATANTENPIECNCVDKSRHRYCERYQLHLEGSRRQYEEYIIE